MSKCELEIVLDKPNRIYQVGDTVTGMVGVTVNTACTCNGLSITREWRTHGQGNRATGGKQTDIVFTGEWTAGEKQVHPFEFTVPRGPLSYRGHHLNVDWYLVANADIPWAFDPQAEIEMMVRTDGDEAPYDMGPRFVTGQAAAANPSFAKVIGTLFGLFFAGIGGIFLLFGLGSCAMGVLSVAAGSVDGTVISLFITVPFIAVPAVFVAVGGFIVYRVWRNALAERRLGPVVLDTPTEFVRPGQTFPVALHFAPKRDVRLDGIKATLKGREVVVRGSGTRKRTYTHDLFEQTLVLTEATTAHGGAQADYEATIAMPDDAPTSFAASDNELRWTLTFTVELAGWPDWQREFVLEVQPAL